MLVGSNFELDRHVHLATTRRSLAVRLSTRLGESSSANACALTRRPFARPHLFSSTATQHVRVPVRTLRSRWSTPVGSAAVLAARFVALVDVRSQGSVCGACSHPFALLPLHPSGYFTCARDTWCLRNPALVALVDTRWSSHGPPPVGVALVDTRHSSSRSRLLCVQAEPAWSARSLSVGSPFVSRTHFTNARTLVLSSCRQSRCSIPETCCRQALHVGRR
jgi:hypothetical protein